MMDGVVIWWISKLMYVCVSFHVLTQLGGCMDFSKNERTDQGGSKEASIRFTRLGLKVSKVKRDDCPMETRELTT